MWLWVAKLYYTSFHIICWLLYKDQNIIWIHPKSQKKIFILRTRLPRKSETRYPFKMTILCMCNWMGTQVEWGFESWYSWEKICITDQKSLIHLPWTVNGASLVLLWSMAVWQGFYTERETTPFGELEHWLGSRIISRSVDRVWVAVRPLCRTMGTPARLGPVCVSHDDAAVEELNHRGTSQPVSVLFCSWERLALTNWGHLVKMAALVGV